MSYNSTTMKQEKSRNRDFHVWIATFLCHIRCTHIGEINNSQKKSGYIALMNGQLGRYRSNRIRARTLNSGTPQ